MNNAKNVLFRVLISIIALLLLIPFLYSFVLSFKDYTSVRGMAGSPFVGFANFSQFVNSQHFGSVAGNTFIICLFSLIVGAVYTFAGGFSVSSAGNKVLKGSVAALFCIPAVIPVNLWIGFIPTGILTTPSMLLQLIAGAIDGLRLAGLVLIAAVFVKGDGIKCGLRLMAVYSAVRLISFFTADNGLMLGLYNPLTYEVLDTMSTYTYRTGMMNGSISASAASYIVKTAMQIIPMVIAVIILKSVLKNDGIGEDGESKSVNPVIILTVIPLVLAVISLIKSSSIFPAGAGELVIKGYVNSLIMSIPSAIFVSAAAVCMAVIAQQAGVFGFAALALLVMTAGNINGEYLIIRTLGLQNTIFAVILQNFNIASLMALIFAAATYNDKTAKSYVISFIIGIVILFGRFWGDYTGAMLYLNDRGIFPISLIAREVIMNPQVEGALIPSIPYALIPIAVSLIGIIGCTAIKKDS